MSLSATVPSHPMYETLNPEQRRSCQLVLSLSHDSLHAANLAILQSHFDASWVSGGTREYVLHNTPRQFPCRLILLEYDVDF